MTTLWVIVGTLLLAPFLVGPLFVYYKWCTSSMPDIVGVHPDQPHMPPQFDPFVQRTVRVLYPAGFQCAAAAILFDGAPNQRFIAMLENPRTREIVLAVLCARGRIRCGQLRWKVRSKSLEFISDFPDGTRVSTDNHGYIRGWSAACARAHLSLPGRKNALALYENHEALTRSAAQYRVKCHLAEGRPLDYLRALHVKDVYAQIRSKILYVDEETGMAHPTLKGALMMGWTELTPLFWFCQMLNYLSAARLTRRLRAAQRQAATSSFERVAPEVPVDCLLRVS